MEERDADDLRQFGYEPMLVRQIGGFSSFAIAFSLISVFTGVFANFGHGLRQVGGAILWSWLLVVVGQTLVALVLAELSTRMPLSGYGYQWTSRLMNPHVGFFIGWLLGLQFLTGFPGICGTLAAEIGRLLGGRWTSPAAVTAVTLMIIATVAMIHLYGIRLAAAINDVGVWTELVGVVSVSGLLIGLAFNRGADPAVLTSTVTAPGGAPAGLGSWALSLLLGAWCLTGFEAAADLAEETRQPRQAVPRAILTSLLAAGVTGGLPVDHEQLRPQRRALQHPRRRPGGGRPGRRQRAVPERDARRAGGAATLRSRRRRNDARHRLRCLRRRSPGANVSSPGQ